MIIFKNKNNLKKNLIRKMSAFKNILKNIIYKHKHGHEHIAHKTKPTY